MLIGPLQGPVLLKLGTVVDEDYPDDEEEEVDWADSVNPANNKITLSVEWKVCIFSWHPYSELASFKRHNTVLEAKCDDAV
jgi:hypothetical protein